MGQAASHEDNVPVLAGRLAPTVMSAGSGCVGAPPLAVARSGAAGVVMVTRRSARAAARAASSWRPATCEAAAVGDGDPAGQDLVAGVFDLVQDGAVEVEGDLDTGPGGGGQEPDAGGGGRMVGPGPGDLEGTSPCTAGWRWGRPGRPG